MHPITTELDKVEATDSGTGSANAATASVDFRELVAVFWDTSGSATLNVEVDVDGSWETLQSKSISSADDGIEVHEVPYTDVRAYLDSNRNKVVVTAGGL